MTPVPELRRQEVAIKQRNRLLQKPGFIIGILLEQNVDCVQEHDAKLFLPVLNGFKVKVFITRSQRLELPDVLRIVNALASLRLRLRNDMRRLWLLDDLPCRLCQLKVPLLTHQCRQVICKYRLTDLHGQNRQLLFCILRLMINIVKHAVVAVVKLAFRFFDLVGKWTAFWCFAIVAR